MEEENFEQQELFEQKKYISDLVEENTKKNKSSLNIIFGSSIITSVIVLSILELLDHYFDWFSFWNKCQ